MIKRESIILFRKADVICIALTITISALFIILSQIVLRSTDSPVLKVEINGETEYYSLETDRNLEFTSKGYSVTVTVAGGCAWVSHSSCPDGVCMSMGKVSKNGQTVVCAPAQIAISVQNAHTGEEDTDAITR